MTQPPPLQPGAAPLSFVQRFIGILTAPRATFASVVSYPKWFGMLAVTTLIVAVFLGGFFLSEVGQQALLDKMAETAPPEQLKTMAANIRIIAIVQVVSIIVISPIFAAIIAGILMGVFTVTGGTAAYKQVLAVVTHAGVASSVAGAATAVLNYFRQTLTSATNFGVFVPNIEENSFLGGFLGTIDLLYLWWLFVLAVGLSVLYRRRTQPIYVSLLAVYALIACAVGAYKAVSGG
jgi:hypothetical protein